MNDLKLKCLEFLYRWVSEGKLGHVRKGQVEELEVFVSSFVQEKEMNQIVNRMVAQTPEKEEG